MSSTPVAFPLKRKRSKSLPVTLLFFIWPLALLYASLKNFRDPLAKRGFILFCLYFGFVFVFSRDIQGADSARYAQNLADLHKLTPSFMTLWNSFYTYETNYLDIYQPIITWVVSLFTDNARYLFAFFALVFGYFYANNLWIVFSSIKGKPSLTLFLFIFVFAFIIPIWTINGVRMWTAAQIFIYGVLLYFIKEEKNGLWWAISSIFVHFSFLLPIMILIIYRFLPKNITLYMVFFVSTLFISEIDLIGVKNTLFFLPEIFHPRVETYTNIEYAERVQELSTDNNWYVQFSGTALKIAIISLMLGLILTGRRILKTNPIQYNYICFVLFFYGLVNLVALVPSVGRFLAVANSLSLVFIILYLSKYKISRVVSAIRVLVVPLLIFYCVFSIRVGFDFIGVSAFIGNPISAIFFEDTKPIIEFIKSLL